MALLFLTRAQARETASRRECFDKFDSFARFRMRVFYKLKDFDELRVGFACDDQKLVPQVKQIECATTSKSSEYSMGNM